MTNFRYNHKATIYLLNWCIPGFFSHSQPLSKGVFGKQVLKALTHSIPLLRKVKVNCIFPYGRIIGFSFDRV